MCVDKEGKILTTIGKTDSLATNMNCSKYIINQMALFPSSVSFALKYVKI